MATFSASDWVIAGGAGQLVLSGADRGSLVLDGCQVTGWRVDARPSPMMRWHNVRGDSWMVSTGLTEFSGPTEFSVSLDFIATGFDELSSTPRDLRLADAMTVRELLGAVHRKLKERGNA